MPPNQRLVRGELDAFGLLQPRLVRHRQRHDEADLVDQHQPVGAGNLDAEREGVADRHQDAEQHERDEDRQQREDRAELPPPDVLPDERQKLHASSLVSTPFSRWMRAPRALGGARIVRHHDDRLAVIAVERLQQVEDLVAGFAIEIARRLVAQQQRGIGDDGARDADALLLAARQLTRIMLGAIGEARRLSARCPRAFSAPPSRAS